MNATMSNHHVPDDATPNLFLRPATVGFSRSLSSRRERRIDSRVPYFLGACGDTGRDRNETD